MFKLDIWISLISINLGALMALSILLFLKFLPPELPLFYSLPWGEVQLATLKQFLIIPASIILITLLNLILSWQLHPSQSFFKKALLLSSLVTTLILIITFIKIVFIFI